MTPYWKLCFYAICQALVKYIPTNIITDINYLYDWLYLFVLDIKGVKDEETLLEEYVLWSNQDNDDENSTNFLGGVVFDNFENFDNKPNLSYKLRLNPNDVWTETQYMFFPVELPGPGFRAGGKIAVLVH